MSTYDVALEYLERGWSVIPVRPDTKIPAIPWKEYQTRLPTEDEVFLWFQQDFPSAQIGLVTGSISGHVVIDCDNEAALAEATHLGWHTPVVTKTRRGFHLWFRHPNNGHYGPQAGSNSTGITWPQVNGLDFRGDGSFVVLPSPGNPYEFKVLAGHDWDDVPTFQPYHGQMRQVDSSPMPLDAFDLTKVPTRQLGDVWEQTRNQVEAEGKMGPGSGRGYRMVRCISHAILNGTWGEADLYEVALRFMDEFYAEPLPQAEVMATIRSMMRAEQRNNPDGRMPPQPVRPSVRPDRMPTITSDNADETLGKEPLPFIVTPFMSEGGGICQVFGYSGSGKSTVVQHLLWAAAAGQPRWGPFPIARALRVLYMNFEEGPDTLRVRIKEDFPALYPNPGQNFHMWTPWLEDEADYHLSTEAGLNHLARGIFDHNPNVVVIDTVRTAWSGLEERSPEAWARVNSLLLKLRNAGLYVIVIHHANKPQNGLLEPGREAGSTNQLTVLETQLKVVQVYRNKEMAEFRGGTYFEALRPEMFGLGPATDLKTALLSRLAPNGQGWSLDFVTRIDVGKKRSYAPEWQDNYLVGIATELATDVRRIVHLPNPMERAHMHYRQGLTVREISQTMYRPIPVIEGWLKLNGPGQSMSP